MSDNTYRNLKKGIKKFLKGTLIPAAGEAFFRLQSRRMPGIQPVSCIYQERSQDQSFCTADNMPEHLTRYTVLLEDRQFYRHPGVDFRAILRDSYLNLKAGYIKYGASTITQQLCKNLYFGFRGTVGRKITELFISLLIESKLTKNQILELYLNTVYFGNGRYGIADASQYYFGVSPSVLSFNQAFSLICMLPFPGIKNPLVFPDEFYSFKERKATHLHNLKALPSAEYEEIICHNAGTPDADLRKPEEVNRWYSEHVPWYNEKFGPFPEVREEEKIIICTVCGEAYGASDKVQKAVAHVIMNRIATREWRKYKTAEEIIRNTGFNAYDFKSGYYKITEEYLENRTGLDKGIERVILNVIPVIRGSEKDFTEGCVMFYSPIRYRFDCLKSGKLFDKRPGWNFDILEKVRFKGCQGDFAFFRYRR